MFAAALLLRSSSHDAHIHYTRCVGRLRKRCLAWSASRSSHGRFGYVQLRVRGCASGLFRFGFRQVRWGLVCIGIPRRLTLELSRPVAGRLNSSVRRRTNCRGSFRAKSIYLVLMGRPRSHCLGSRSRDSTSRGWHRNDHRSMGCSTRRPTPCVHGARPSLK